MEKNLKKLLEQINFDESCMPYFKDGLIKRIVTKKNTKNYTFYLLLKETLPLEIKSNFIKCVEKTFDGYKVDVKFEAKEKNYIEEYIQEFLNNNDIKETSLKVKKENIN